MASPSGPPWSRADDIEAADRRPVFALGPWVADLASCALQRMPEHREGAQGPEPDAQDGAPPGRGFDDIGSEQETGRARLREGLRAGPLHVPVALAQVDHDLGPAGGEVPLPQVREPPLEVPQALDEPGESLGLPTGQEPAAQVGVVALDTDVHMAQPPSRTNNSARALSVSTSSTSRLTSRT